MILDRMPLNVSGKVDRRILTKMAQNQIAQQGPKRQPTSEIEQYMQAIWSQVLNIAATKIVSDDNFFKNGGDCIAAIKVVGEARKVGIKLAVADLFRKLANHSAHLHYDLGASKPFDLVREKVDVDCFLQGTSTHYQLGSAKIIDAYPCTPLQEDLISLTSKQSGNYIKQHVLDISPNANPTDLQMAWERVFCATPILRTRFIPHNELGLVQVVSDGHLLWIDATGIDEYLKADSKRPMELSALFTRFALRKDSSSTIKWFV